MSVRIINADVFDGLAELPDESVHCVVTSPPYWGLRDYGTGRWEGGDPKCAHRSPTMREGRNESRAKLAGSAATNSAQLLLAHHVGVCGKCGARKVDAQIGLEPTLAEHLDVMVRVFREVRRVLRKDGTCWVNYGDCYATSPNGRSAADTKAAGNDIRTFRDKPFSTIQANMKAKDLCMVPNRLAIALQDDGWWVRSEIIWHKPNPMPESITDRPATAHEKIWLLSKSARYWYDAEAVRQPAAEASVQRWAQDVESQEGSHRANGGAKTNGTMKAVGGRPGGRKPEKFDSMISGAGRSGVGEGSGSANLKNVWSITTKPFSDAHFATFPPEIPELCIKAGCPVHTCAECGYVLDFDVRDVRATTDGHDLQPLSGNLQRSAVSRGPDALLQPALSECREEGGAGEGSLRMVRGASGERSTRSSASLLQQSVRSEAHSEESSIDDRPLCDDQGLCGDLHSKSSECVTSGICHGAPAGDGGASGPPSSTDRGCASSERGKGGQPAGELGDHDEVRARQAAEAARGRDQLPPLRRRDFPVPACPSCSADLTVEGSTKPGTTLDPFGGAGTTGMVADRLLRNAILIELNPEYAEMARRRIKGDCPMFSEVA